jgi:hypothetical protein
VEVEVEEEEEEEEEEMDGRRVDAVGALGSGISRKLLVAMQS